jgi:hypothetical protein
VPTDPTTPDDLAELRRLVEAATSGPWKFSPNRYRTSGVVDAAKRRVASSHVGEKSDGQALHDGEFIAAANPATVIRLLDRLAAAESELAAMEKQIAITELAADLGTIFTYCEKCHASVQKDSGAECKCVVDRLRAELARRREDEGADLLARIEQAGDVKFVGNYRDAVRQEINTALGRPRNEGI